MSNQPQPKQSKLMAFKCDEYLLDAFKDICKQNDCTASQILRSFMREYIKKHRQGELKL